MASRTPKVHPAIKTKTAEIRPPQPELWDKTFTPEQLGKVFHMLDGYRRVYRIDFTPVVRKQEPGKFSHVILLYPKDTFELFLAEPPEDVGRRLDKRGITYQANEKYGYLNVIWPVEEIIKLADIWCDLDAAGATCMYMDEKGMVCGTVQKF